LKAALAPVGYEDAFMPAVSPAELAGWNKNEFYKTDEESAVSLRTIGAIGTPRAGDNTFLFSWGRWK
jgi:hypothetical protein